MSGIAHFYGREDELYQLFERDKHWVRGVITKDLLGYFPLEGSTSIQTSNIQVECVKLIDYPSNISTCQTSATKSPKPKSEGKIFKSLYWVIYFF